MYNPFLNISIHDIMKSHPICINVLCIDNNCLQQGIIINGSVQKRLMFNRITFLSCQCI